MVSYALFQADVCYQLLVDQGLDGTVCLVLHALFQADVCSQLLVDQGLDQYDMNQGGTRKYSSLYVYKKKI